ncbi:hypothetical protein [Sorangium sp. So ce1078]|uniref:hypothetical protein n=1 Tax=Sorangium sp. So ce1078 TaxID=3133329 RepID=UPI003F6212A0
MNDPSLLRVIGVSGSPPARSLSSALLHAAIELAPRDVEIARVAGLGEVPRFNEEAA